MVAQWRDFLIAAAALRYVDPEGALSFGVAYGATVFVAIRAVYSFVEAYREIRSNSFYP